jgi:hypothetical protein
VASLWAQRLPLVASMSCSTSFGVVPSVAIVLQFVEAGFDYTSLPRFAPSSHTRLPFAGRNRLGLPWPENATSVS